jgi:hypothetical protein
MPSRERQINALIKKAKEQYSTIKSQYDLSLAQQSVSDDLSIDIKNMCENLRSALNYLAHDIREIHCPSANKNDKFYFPIILDINQFQSRISQWYLGLDITSPSLWNYLESVQPYHGESTIWIHHFNRLTNENKHDSLIPQTKSTKERVHVNIGRGGSVDWDPSAVRFGKGVYIGGVPVDPSTQMPIPHPSQEVKRIIWVDFHFEDIPGSAIGLLQCSLDGVEKITTKVREWL